MSPQDTVAHKIAAELNIEQYPENLQERIIVSVGENVLKRIVIKMHAFLPEDKHSAFEAEIQAGNMDNIMAFLSIHVPNLDTAVDEIVSAAVNELKERLNPQ